MAALTDPNRSPFNSQRHVVQRIATDATAALAKVRLAQISRQMFPYCTGGALEINFDKALQRGLQESHFWQYLQGQTIRLPFAILELMKHQDRLFLLQQHVLRVVKAYNAVVEGLAASSTPRVTRQLICMLCCMRKLNYSC